MSEQNYSEWMERGDASFRKGDYGKAVKAFERAVKADDGSAVAWLARGHALLAADRYGKGVASLRRGLALDPGWPYNEIDLRGFYPDEIAFGRQRSRLRAAMAKRPSDPVLLFADAYLSTFSGELERAGTTLAHLLHVAPDDVDALHLSGAVVARTDHRPVLAEDDDPTSTVDDVLAEGDAHLHESRYDQAARSFGRGVTVFPESHLPRLARGHALFALQQYDAAAETIMAGMLLEPRWGWSSIRVAQFYPSRSVFDDALRGLFDTREERGADPELVFLLAYVLHFDERYADAAQVLAELLRLDPHHRAGLYLAQATASLAK